jgi:hypothetical protein
MDYTLIVISVVIIIGLFILLREFVCWYFKINEIVELLKKLADGNPVELHSDFKNPKRDRNLG